MNRRDNIMLMLSALAATLPVTRAFALPEGLMEDQTPQYGLIGQMIATPGQRAALAEILAEGTGEMQGNFGYLIGEDSANADALWIVEVWADKEAHGASLKLPSVQAAIAKGRPLIAGFGQRFEFKPLAGVRG